MADVQNPPAFPSDRLPMQAVYELCAELEPLLAKQVRHFCDEAYNEIMETVQDYLRDNAKFNIKSKFDAQQREVVSAHGALRAVEDATTLQEAKSNAYAARKGYWTAAKAAEYRAEAEALAARQEQSA